MPLSPGSATARPENQKGPPAWAGGVSKGEAPPLPRPCSRPPLRRFPGLRVAVVGGEEAPSSLSCPPSVAGKALELLPCSGWFCGERALRAAAAGAWWRCGEGLALRDVPVELGSRWALAVGCTAA